jgi:hypothetical protein
MQIKNKIQEQVKAATCELPIKVLVHRVAHVRPCMFFDKGRVT